MGVIGDLIGLAVFGEDVRPNQRSKSPIWSILLKLLSYLVAMMAAIFLFAPMFEL